MKSLNEHKELLIETKSERYWDKKFSALQSIMITDEGLDLDEFLQRLGLEVENVKKDKAKDMSTTAWLKLKGDVDAKESAIGEYIDGGYV